MLSTADFDPSTSELSFTPGSVILCSQFDIIDDDVVEPTESFTVSLSVPGAEAVVGALSMATVVILDDDGKSLGLVVHKRFLWTF